MPVALMRVRRVQPLPTFDELVEDAPRYDIWRARWNGSERRPLTRTPDADDWQPMYSPDGKRIAFLSDRGGEDAETQVWVLPADAGEAEQLTDYPGGVVDFAWSPDGKSLAIIVNDPELAEGEEEPPQPKPIVIDRYQFKLDFTDFLTARRQHLYLVDIASGKTTQLTSGQHDEYLPAFSPDGKQIAYVTKRGPDPTHLNWRLASSAAGVRKAGPKTIGDEGSRLESRPLSPTPTDRLHKSGEEMDLSSTVVRIIRSGEDDTARGVELVTRAVFTARAGGQRSVEESRVTHGSRIDLATGRVTPLTTAALRFRFAAAQRQHAVLGGDDLHLIA